DVPAPARARRRLPRAEGERAAGGAPGARGGGGCRRGCRPARMASGCRRARARRGGGSGARGRRRRRDPPQRLSDGERRLRALVAMLRLRIRGAPGALEAAVRASAIAERVAEPDPFVRFVMAAALLADGGLREALPLLEAAVPPLSEQMELAFGGAPGSRRIG